MDRIALRQKEKEALARKLYNVNINDCTSAFLGIVADKQPGTIFYDYEPKAKIGMNIYAELMDKYRDGKGFILSDDMEEVGILSQAQGASTLDTLIGRFDVITMLNRQDAQQLTDIYQTTIRDILNRVNSGEGGYLFDATPYNITVFDRESAYMDTITWVISAFLGAISLDESSYSCVGKKSEKISISFSNAETDQMLKVIAYCIRYITENYIDVSEERRDALARGWNFTGGCSEPSLYFTYAVSECYLDIYSVFKPVIDRHNIWKKYEKVKNDPRHAGAEDYWMYISADDRIAYESAKDNSEEYKKLDQYFGIINGAGDFFYTLEQQVKSSAKNAWPLVQKGIDTHFYNYNLSAVIEPQAIESSSSSDALFNNIFVINNVISGGLDEDLKDALASAEDDDEMSRIQSEYDDLLETLQAAVQRMIRYSKTLRSRRKDYIINDYFISCSESFEGELNRKAQELRKKRIKAFSLSPLLVKTNNLISEYLTQYPQIDMVKYLDEMLMKKRTTLEDLEENGVRIPFHIWIWENGEYLVTSNYYYISSLASFYEYAEIYESRFRDIDRGNARIRETIILKHDEESRASGEIFELNSQVNTLRESEARLQQQVSELESRKSEVEEVLRDFLKNELKTNMMTWLTDNLRSMNRDVLTDLPNETFREDRREEIAFLKELRRTMIVTFYDEIQYRLGFLNKDKDTISLLVELFEKKLDSAVKDQLNEISKNERFNETSNK